MNATSPPSASIATDDNWGDLLSGRNLALTIVLASGVLLYAMNLYFTAALMPSIVEDIGGQRYYAWVTTSFVVAAIVASLFVSRILEQKGPAFAYMLGLIGFSIGAFGNALSPGIEALLVGRVIQGLGGGLLAGLGYAVIRMALPQRHWARATGVVSAMWGLGTLFGPALGGVFAQFGLWRWAYAGLAVTALLIAVIAQRSFRNMPATGNSSPVPLPSLAALIAAIFVISLSAVAPSLLLTLGALLAGAAFLALFLRIERKAAYTILPRATYDASSPLKWVYLTVAAISAGVLLENFIPLFGQQLGGLAPFAAGLLGAVLSLAWMVAQLLIVSVRSEAIRMKAMRAGPVMLTIGLILYGSAQVAEAGNMVLALWIAALFLSGFGIGLAWPLLGVAAMSSTTDPAEGGKAAAAITTAQLMAFSVTSALVGMIMSEDTGPSALDARLIVLGIAALTAFGIVTSRRIKN